MKALLALAAVAGAAFAPGGAGAASAPEAGFRWGVRSESQQSVEPSGRWYVRPDAIGRYSLISPKARAHGAIGRW
jgi:hypothetical protein